MYDPDPAPKADIIILSEDKPTLSFREDFYLQLIRLNPDDIDSYLKLARYYFDSNRWENAEGMFRRVIALDPDHMEANNALFKLMKRKGHLAGMELFLDILDRLAPGNYLEARLDLYHDWSRYHSREPLLRKAGMLSELNWHFVQERRYTNLRWLASESFAADTNYSHLEEEIVQLRNAEIHEPDYTFYTGLLEMRKPAFLPVPDLDPLRNRDAMEYAQGAFSSVIAENYPATAQSLFWLSELDGKMTRYLEYYQEKYRKELDSQDAFLKNATKAVDASPGNLDFQLLQISALLKNWKYQEALAKLEPLEKDHRLDAEWTLTLARLRVLSGKQAEAQHTLDQVQYAFIRPEEAPDAWYRTQGLLNQLSGRHEAAQTDFHTIVSRTYDSADDYYQQCRSLAEKGDLVQALAVLDAAWINGFQYDRVFKYDPHFQVLREWTRFEEWKKAHSIQWNAYRRATRYN